jgi:hypothetical protein
MVPGLQHRRLRSFDGTEIAHEVRGDGPVVVLVNSVGESARMAAVAGAGGRT